jgi:glyoxylase-like metal-dependent hydrolase (beta-lactamase superfamily II)
MQILNFNIRKQLQNLEVDLYPSIIKDGNEIYLIDCGYEDTFDDFMEAFASLKISDLTGIIISHDDIDHLGALSLFKEAYPSIKIFCSEIERNSVEGITKSERLIQAENSLPHLPEEYKPWALGFIQQLQNIKRIPVDITLTEDDRIADQIRVIYTPGHTSGHISLYIPSLQTVIANDALVIENGEFNIANPQFCLDLKNAIQSVEKIKNLNPKKIICYHGGMMEEQVDNKLQQLLYKFNIS